MSRRYASYWNALLFSSDIEINCQSSFPLRKQNIIIILENRKKNTGKVGGILSVRKSGNSSNLTRPKLVRDS